MNIIVLVKRVPDTEANIKITSDKQSIDETEVKFVVNPYDEFAIEEALKIKEAGGAESVTALSLGTESSVQTLRTALAMGVDEAVLIKTDRAVTDGLTVAKALAFVLKEMDFGLILMGKEAIDDGNMQVGPMLGEVLDIPCITVVSKLTLEGDKVVIERETDGAVEVLESQTPSIITCQKGLNEPRYPSIRGIMQSKRKQIVEKTVELAVENITVDSLSYPPSRPAGKIVGEGAEAVPELVKLLKEEAKVI